MLAHLKRALRSQYNSEKLELLKEKTKRNIDTISLWWKFSVWSASQKLVGADLQRCDFFHKTCVFLILCPNQTIFWDCHPDKQVCHRETGIIKLFSLSSLSSCARTAELKRCGGRCMPQLSQNLMLPTLFSRFPCCVTGSANSSLRIIPKHVSRG